MKKKDKDIILHQLNNIDTIGELSDGYHTFDSLYHQRLVLFATLVKLNKGRSWKTKRHEDGEECFDGNWFLVCIDTPAGPYSYHFELEHWDMFDCQEIEKAKPFDGHTDKDVERLLSLSNDNGKFYVIKKYSHEFNDYYSGYSDSVIFITKDKAELDKMWKKIVEKELKWVENIKNILRQREDADPLFIDENYQVYEHTEDRLEIWVDNWAYEWWLDELDNNILLQQIDYGTEQEKLQGTL